MAVSIESKNKLYPIVIIFNDIKPGQQEIQTIELDFEHSPTDKCYIEALESNRKVIRAN